MRATKCYWNYTPKLYRLLVLILFPIILVVVAVATSANKVPAVAMIGLFSTEIFYEIFADNWMLNGIQSKDYRGIHLIQSSTEGKAFMKKVVLMDCIRRYVYMAVVCLCFLSIHILVGGSDNLTEDVMFLWNSFWLAGAVISLFIWIGRYFSNMVAVMLLSYLGVFGFAFLASAWGTMKIGCVIYPLISLGISGLCVAIGMKKMEGCYYDR